MDNMIKQYKNNPRCMINISLSTRDLTVLNYMQGALARHLSNDGEIPFVSAGKCISYLLSYVEADLFSDKRHDTLSALVEKREKIVAKRKRRYAEKMIEKEAYFARSDS